MVPQGVGIGKTPERRKSAEKWQENWEQGLSATGSVMSSELLNQPHSTGKIYF